MRTHSAESGNVFFIILIGIVMFAALMFTFSRGARQGTESLGNRETELAASEILSYAQKVERGVQRILARNISESDISFENDNDLDYTNPGCSTDQCRVFQLGGGAVTWQAPPSGVNSGENYEFLPNQVGDAAEPATLGAVDLVLLLPVNVETCAALNNMTTHMDAWDTTVSPNITDEYIGNFTPGVGARISWSVAPDNRWSGCFCEGLTPCAITDPHYFYHVIHRRG